MPSGPTSARHTAAPPDVARMALATPQPKVAHSAILFMVAVCSVVVIGCQPAAAPAPTPTPTTSVLHLYVQRTASWYQVHAATLVRVVATIERLASSADEKAGWGSGSLSGFLSIDPNQMSAEEVLAALGAAARPALDAEQLDALASEKDELEQLLLLVNRDEATLFQQVPPSGTDTAFQELAASTIDVETAVLVALLRFYSSPELERGGPAFDEFPTQFTDARIGLGMASDLWARAQLARP